MTTLEDILAHRANGSWRALEQRAQAMVLDAAHHAGAKFEPRLGGGTRLMLSLNHRISDDIDLFIRDPQWIGYLTPRLNDRVEESVSGYSENAVSLKLEYKEGEIDFIVGMSLLGLPDESAPETEFPLEPVAEVLAKKLFYRGWGLTPRDLYDWWCIEERAPDAIPEEKFTRLLKTKFPEIERSLSNITSSRQASTMWDAIRAPDKPTLASTAAWALHTLTRYAETASRMSARTAALPALEHCAGTKYLLWQIAADEIAQTGSTERVDWQRVEHQVMRIAIQEHQQPREVVIEALAAHSPGAVTERSISTLRAYAHLLDAELSMPLATPSDDTAPAP